MARTSAARQNASAGSGVWKSDSVKDVAESIGIASLPEDVAQALAGDVEYRLWDLIEEASKFMRHSRRTRLKVEDVDQALRLKNFEPLWGFNSTQHIPFRRAVTNTGTVYALEDEEIDLSKVLKADKIEVPRPVSFTAHWLAVEGVQPLVKENPTPSEIAKYARPVNQAVSTNQANGTTVTPLVKHVLSKELQLYFTRLTEALSASSNDMRDAALGSVRTDPGLHQLVPYLTAWANEEIANKLDDLVALERSLDLFNAMFDNPTLFVEPYLHQIVPAILTCILTSSLPASTDAHQTYPNAYQIRSTACSLLALLMNRYSSSYPSMRPRIVKTLLRGLGGPDRGLGARWGAAHALSVLLPQTPSGSPVIRDWLGTGLKALGEMIASESSSSPAAAAAAGAGTAGVATTESMGESKEDVMNEVINVLRASLVTPPKLTSTTTVSRKGKASSIPDASGESGAVGPSPPLEDFIERYGELFGQAIKARWQTGGKEIWDEVTGVHPSGSGSGSGRTGGDPEDEDEDEDDEDDEAMRDGEARDTSRQNQEDDEDDDEDDDEEDDDEDEDMNE